MKEFIRKRERNAAAANVVGIVLTVLVEAGGVALVCNSGLKYLDPPPAETSFLIDFTEMEAEVVPPKVTKQKPRSENPDKTKPVELAQRSESPYQSSKPNTTPASAPDTHGDVDVPTPEQEPKVDPRAAFPGMSKKDTTQTAPHGALDSKNLFKAGQPDGNTTNGRADNKTNAWLEGRPVNGNIIKPNYNVQEGGKVVVKIWVDQSGTVVKAQVDANGTTVDNKTLWAEARNAAMATHFQQKGDAPVLQEGKITYYFNLK